MAFVKAVFGWIGRRAMLFGLLVAAFALQQVIVRSSVTFRDLRQTVAALEIGARGLPAFTAAAIDQNNRAVADAQRSSIVELDRRIVDATRARDEGVAACRVNPAVLLVRSGAEGVLKGRQRCIAAALHDREIVALRVLRDTAAIRRPGETLRQAMRRQAATMREQAALNRAAVTRIGVLRKQTFGEYRYAAELRRLQETARVSNASYLAAKANGERLIAGQNRIARATERTAEATRAVRAGLDRFVAGKREELSGTAVERAHSWAEWLGLDRLLRSAAIAFVAIVATPYLIRILFYWLLAPIAERRPVIRLRVPGGPVPLAPPSTTSIGIRLAADEELLVRQDYLQATAADAAKRTRWLLDWRHPLTSLAAGLWFLTRIRGDATLTTVSAVRDAFAEVTVLTLPQGSACVLQPRALAAVAQPIGRPVKVTAHWRLGSLHAWLTLQLRYLVFHGPVRLAIKGGRGVRVEPAERGRVFGQDQLVGFGAGLGYSVARTETFWPYFFGREPLFRDRVAEAEGVLIIEEAPMAGRKGGIGRGLEGAVDAAMKVFGV